MRMLLFSNTRGMHVIINESVVRWVLDKRKIMMPTTFVVGKRGATRSISSQHCSLVQQKSQSVLFSSFSLQTPFRYLRNISPVIQWLSINKYIFLKQWYPGTRCFVASVLAFVYFKRYDLLKRTDNQMQLTCITASSHQQGQVHNQPRLSPVKPLSKHSFPYNRLSLVFHFRYGQFLYIFICEVIKGLEMLPFHLLGHLLLMHLFSRPPFAQSPGAQQILLTRSGDCIRAISTSLKRTSSLLAPTSGPCKLQDGRGSQTDFDEERITVLVMLDERVIKNIQHLQDAESKCKDMFRGHILKL